MESVDFLVTTTGDTMEEAFENAVRKAREEHGSGPNTGTIADKTSCTYILFTASPQEAIAHAERLLDASDPRISDEWGPAGAIEVREDPENGKRWLFFGKAAYTHRGGRF